MNLNEGAKFWFYRVGVDTIPSDTRRKQPIRKWQKYQDNPMSVEEFETFIKEGKFEKGLAIIPGRIPRGENKGKYLIAIDIDNEKGLNEFLTRNGKVVPIKEFASKTLVEQHKDAPNRAHFYFISPVSFPSKGSDNKIGLEVKAEGKQIMFVSPSTHENGCKYEILGTDNIAVLNHKQAIELMRHLDSICSRYELEYLDKESNTRLTPQIREMIEKLKIDKTITILEGERHNTLLSIADSVLIRYHNSNISLEKLKNFFEDINEQLCQLGPLPKKEIDVIWESAIEFVERNKIQNKISQFKKKAALIEEATEKILSSSHTLTIEESKEILYYQDGVYIKGGETLIEKELEKYYSYQLNTHDINEIKGYIMRKTYTKYKKFDNDLNIIDLKNGLYNIQTEKLESHSINYYSLKQKPISYNKTIKPQLFGKFLKEVLHPSQIRTAVEIMAYTFLRQHLSELYFILVGKGANGKSVFTGLLTELHGIKNVSNVPLSSLLGDRFALADLENKDVNIDAELSGTTIKDMSILKRLTGKQPIRIERKNKDAYDISIHAKLFFNANSLPETYDNSDAIIRRQTILNFPNQFEEGKNADPKLLEKLTTEEELSGIFNVLMIALKRILKNNMLYLNQKTIREKRERLELLLNSVQFFIDDALDEKSTESDSIAKIDLYNAYENFCKSNNIHPENIEKVGRILKNPPYNFLDGRETKGTKRKNIWKGVRLKKWALEQTALVFENLS